MYDETRNCVMALMGAFGERAFPPQRVELYAEVLSDIPLPELKAAILETIKSSKYAPSVAEIRERASFIENAVKEKEAPNYAKAWERLVQGTRRYGSYQEDKFYAELAREGAYITLTAIKRFGGIKDYGKLPDSALGTAKAQFRDIYNNAVQEWKDKKHAERIRIEYGFQPASAKALPKPASRLTEFY